MVENSVHVFCSLGRGLFCFILFCVTFPAAMSVFAFCYCFEYFLDSPQPSCVEPSSTVLGERVQGLMNPHPTQGD